MKREFSKYENANAILNGMEDCVDDFVQGFVELHNMPIDDTYMYDWLLRSILDKIKINQSVLYVACGTAGYTRLFSNIKRFVGIDFSKKMIEAAKTITKKHSKIDFAFFNTTFEAFDTGEKFDLIYLGPYGHNVPHKLGVLEKAKTLLNDNGFIFLTCPDPNFKNFFYKLKELIRNIFVNKDLNYDKHKYLKSLIKRANLEVMVELRMNNTIGHCFCYIVKK